MGLVACFETNDLHLHKGNGVWYNPDERSIIEAADYVIAATRWMAQTFARINPKTIVASEAIEDEFWTTPKPALPDAPLVVSWHGTASNLQYVDPVVGWFADSGVKVVLRVVMPEKDHRGRSNREHMSRYPIPTQFVVWQKDTWVRDISAAHATIAPLPMTAFCFAKGCHKAIASMALGLPCLASSVPPYREVIRDGETGLLAATPEEWQHGIKLLSDPNVRRSMGEAGREFSKHFTREAVGDHWNRVLEGVCKEQNLS